MYRGRTAREARFFCNVLCYCDVNAAVFANALDSTNYEIDMKSTEPNSAEIPQIVLNFFCPTFFFNERIRFG